MNYINQINIFFRIAGSAELTSSARVLYFALLNKNNQLAWIKRFTCTASELEGTSGLSQSGLQRARNQLVDKGFVSYFKRGANRAPQYEVHELLDERVLTILNNTSNNTAVNSPVSTPNNSPVNSPVSTPNNSPVNSANTLNKLNKTKSNKTKSNKEDDEEAPSPPVKNSYDLWNSLWGFPNAIAQQDLAIWIKDIGDELVSFAIKIAARHDVAGKAANKYIERVISRWQEMKITTVAEAQQAIDEHDKQVSNAIGGRMSKKGRVKETMPDWATESSKPPDTESDLISQGEFTDILKGMKPNDES